MVEDEQNGTKKKKADGENELKINHEQRLEAWIEFNDVKIDPPSPWSKQVFIDLMKERLGKGDDP